MLGWASIGIWESGYDGSDINTVDRSNLDHDGYQLLALGDDKSKVKIYKWPCAQMGADKIELMGHSSHVTKVKFTFDDSHLISVGGNDTCVFHGKITDQS